MADSERMAMLREKFHEAGGGEEPEEVVEAQPEETPAEEPAGTVEAEATGEEKPGAGRDQKGRFASQAAETAPREPKQAAKTAKAATPAAAPVAAPVAEAAEKPIMPAVPPAPTTKPPQSWSHAEKEAWSKLPEPAQRAVLRREQETAKVLQENAQIRKSYTDVAQRAQQVDNLVRPFEGLFRAQGVEPMQGVASLVQTYAALNMGSQQQKDGLLAGLIQQYGSLEGINAYLQGQAQMPPPQRPQAPVQPQQDVRALLREEIGRIQEQAAVGRAERDFEEFKTTTPEFLDEKGVWETMEQFLDTNAARGRNVTYQQAYDFAVQMDPEIQATLKQRAAAAAATQPNATASTARARAASATVKPKPASAVGTQTDVTDRRAMLQAAMDRSRR